MGRIIDRRRVMGGKKLPYDAEIEYLESTGTQYIDTLISCNQDTKIITDIKQVSGSNQWRVWIGALKTLSDGNWIHLGQASLYRGLRFSWGVGEHNFIYTNIASNDFDKHNYCIYSGCIIIDNTNRYEVVDEEFDTSPSTIVLFADRKANFITEKSCIQIFNFKLYNKNTLVRDFIPVRVGNVGYMYDKVSGQLFGNQGTGDFIVGPDK